MLALLYFRLLDLIMPFVILHSLYCTVLVVVTYCYLYLLLTIFIIIIIIILCFDELS